MQALSALHSELTIHSGLHCGGVPMYPDWHEQTACPLLDLQLLLGPHGDGIHGFSFSLDGAFAKN